MLGQTTYSNNFQFVLNLIDSFQIQTLDYLACNSLNYSNWKSYYDLICSLKDIKVGASNDNTGNVQYGGDWVMESTQEDIKNIYWNSNIDNYS